MSLGSIGCCCGIIAGFVVSTFVAVAVGIGVYFYVNPEAKDNCLKTIEKSWDSIKSNSEEIIDDITKNNVKPTIKKANDSVAKSTESLNIKETSVEKIKDDFSKIYSEDFFASTDKKTSNEKLPEIPKSKTGDFWR